MPLCLESGYTSLNKKGEELCGDKVETRIDGDFTTLVLCDGMGSGVKANILSTLSSKILCTMVANGIPMDDCIETLIASLPVCKVRGVAYSTFSVVHMNSSGKGYLVEFDNPPAICMHEGKCRDLPSVSSVILGKTVRKTELNLSEGDVIVLMSDGVPHAGIGKLMNFGWQRPEIMSFLDRVAEPGMSARCIANLLAAACNDLYLDQPGDDTTVAAVRVREKCPVSLMVGPPVDKEKDDFYISRFLEGEGKKVVCGGTTSTIVARHLHTQLVTKFDFPDKDIPPIGYIEGVDLTTEGVLTLRRVLELSEKYLSVSDLSSKRQTKPDGASLLANLLFEEATDVRFFVGQSVNKAHQSLPIDITMKLKLVENLASNLKKMGKNVELLYD